VARGAFAARRTSDATVKAPPPRGSLAPASQTSSTWLLRGDYPRCVLAPLTIHDIDGRGLFGQVVSRSSRPEVAHHQSQGHSTHSTNDDGNSIPYLRKFRGTRALPTSFLMEQFQWMGSCDRPCASGSASRSTTAPFSRANSVSDIAPRSLSHASLWISSAGVAACMERACVRRDSAF